MSLGIIGRQGDPDHTRLASAAMGRPKDAAPQIADPGAAAELMVRLAISFHLAPHSSIPLETEADLRSFARTYLVPLLRLPT